MARTDLWERRQRASLQPFAMSVAAPWDRGRGLSGERARSARLKVDPAGSPKPLSAHPFLTGQGGNRARQGRGKALILLNLRRDRCAFVALFRSYAGAGSDE